MYRRLARAAIRWLTPFVVFASCLAGAAESDRVFPNRIDRLAYPSRRLKTLPGLLRWSRRVSGLIEELRPRFIWCGNLRPAAYPAKWARERRASTGSTAFSKLGSLVLPRAGFESRRARDSA